MVCMLLFWIPRYLGDHRSINSEGTKVGGNNLLESRPTTTFYDLRHQTGPGHIERPILPVYTPKSVEVPPDPGLELNFNTTTQSLTQLNDVSVIV